MYNNTVTNNHVKNNEGCLNFVEETLKLIEYRDFGNLSVTPRKSPESSFIVFHSKSRDGGGESLCTTLPRKIHLVV